MKFFLDTADVGELREAAASGLVDGVTTNPSLIAKTGRKLGDVVREIVEIVDGPISVETISTDAPGMIKEGLEFVKIHKNIVVKAPLTREGLKATKALASEGAKVNVTLCFSALQALLAAKAGAAYISPFVGRLDDVGQDGMVLIRDICLIYQNYDFNTEVLAASLRHPIHVLEAAKAGAHVGTLPYKVFQQLYDHPLTDIGLAKFLSDWKKVPSA
ncbi:fructose-6-phosphate aldolase [Hydrocarboniphaga effusa]|uniref:fructose-6-phosphate aldolase n=1 Tax=Hydrocarboniphaga effusa TaxID=243629 RepID=UPI00398C0F3F